MVQENVVDEAGYWGWKSEYGLGIGKRPTGDRNRASGVAVTRATAADLCNTQVVYVTVKESAGAVPAKAANRDVGVVVVSEIMRIVGANFRTIQPDHYPVP